MKHETRKPLKIVGNSNSPGGYFSEALIVGDGEIEGDLDCITLKCVGNSRINGNLKAEIFKTVGSTSVSGSVTSRDIRIAGNVDTKGSLKADTIVVRGGLEVRESISAGEMRARGYLTVKKNCEAERFSSTGPLVVDGLLNAEHVDLKLHSRCRVAEIGGETISVHRGNAARISEILKSLFLPPDYMSGKLVADTIEGDDIHIEHTKARVVRAKHIVIGPGCEIELVEYKSSFHCHGRSIVKTEKKVK